jgi:hypothetical protein
MPQRVKKGGLWFLPHLIYLTCFAGGSPVQTQTIYPSNNVLDQEKRIQANTPNFNILIWGGGYSPSGNEISLESNVKYLQRVQSKIGLGSFDSKILFADGTDPARDLQFFDPQFVVPKSNLILAEVFGSTRGIYNQYRSNQLQTNVESTENEIDTWINDLNQTSPHSINLIYFTGHGGKADKKEPFNTTAYLWDNKKLKVSDFAKKMNRIPQQQSTILVMVQCYSGGYANIIFKDADPVKGLHKHARAGFFATVRDRVAAGCTPDIREENYQEYSTRFWEALCGETRTGNIINTPDYDQDGATSLLEAHSYVIINSNTIDIPVKTTDVFLRKFSATKPTNDQNVSTPEASDKSRQKKLSSSILNADSNSSLQTRIPSAWLYPEDPIRKIYSKASTESKAIITQLSQRLGLIEPNRFKEADHTINQLKKKREELSKKKKEKEDQRKQLQIRIKNRLKKEWPELSNLHHPKIDFIKHKNNSKKLVELANINKDWEKMISIKNEISKIEKQRFQLEKKQILGFRLKREIENVVLEIALPKINAPDIVQKYEQLAQLERTILRKSN